MKTKKYYAAYKGDEFIDLGDIDYLSRKLQIKPSNLKWHTSKAAHKRAEGKTDRLYIFKMEE